MTIIDKTDGPVTLAFTGSFSIWHWLIVLAVVLLLFGGGGKIPRLMKDLGTGVKSFKKGLKDGESAAPATDADGKAIEGSGTVAAEQPKDKTTAS